ncbi:MAG: AAA family ATPase [Nitrospirales bacterium]|nr:AAA family ATPase [Nitrospirales bacterium]
MLTSLEITGLRGFASKQTLTFSLPNGTPGSGLTVIVGANNAGKSTAIEALRAVAQRQGPSFTQGRRNQAAGDQVLIRAADADGNATVLKSVRPGSSETEYIMEHKGVDLSKLLVLPARRVFSPYFNRSVTTRDDYMANIGFPAIRTSTMDQFTYRLFAIEKNRAQFDQLLKRVVDPVPDWSIDQMDNGQYFLKIRKGSATHSSEGLGEGLVSLLFIVDALYDSKDGDTIAVDEPELSLHPALQQKLSDLLLEYSATRQIAVSTHSPHFAGLAALPNGATVARVHAVDEESRISQLSSATAKKIFGLMKNDNNPHVLGLAAQEIFFIEDRVILVEGQEDVVFFKKVQSSIEPLEGTFFGWGVGGAENMERIATVLKELGFSKVVGILDGNRAQLAQTLKENFPLFHFFSIPADDIRTKSPVPERPAVVGLLNDANNAIRPEYLEKTKQLLQKANVYLRG